MTSFEDVVTRFKALAPMEFEARCGNRRHKLMWDGKDLVQSNHDPESEDVIEALGADRPICMKIVDAWTQRDELPRGPKLAESLLGTRVENESLRFLGFFLRSGRVAVGREDMYEWILAFWEAQKQLRQVFVAGKLIDEFTGSSSTVRDFAAGVIASVLDGEFRLDARGKRSLRLLSELPAAPLGPYTWSLKELLQLSRSGLVPKDHDLRSRMLREISAVFEKGREYRTIEVEDLLRRYSKNQRRLRAALIEGGFLTGAKAQGRYLRV